VRFQVEVEELEGKNPGGLVRVPHQRTKPPGRF